MRIVFIACLLFVTSGCAALLPGQQTLNTQSDLFHTALEQLLQDNNPKPMTQYVKDYPESPYLDDAKRLLTMHENSRNTGEKLKICSQKLEASQQDMKKLQEDIDRLTQLNLEMDRSSP